ncbi:MAG: helix-turn-helix transcriptional regulator [Deltaproteobacteria bacterium]|nr:helix-turn-helix transcriptional regulator [Deltaproteobacteria bacterium]
MPERTGRNGRAADDLPSREAWFFAADGEEYAILEERALARPLPSVLTAAERTVAGLAGAGVSNAEIARRRGCGVHTVSKQLSSVYRKLGLEGRAALQAWLAAGREDP